METVETRKTPHLDTWLWLLLGSAAGTWLTVVAAPGLLPALAASVSGATAYWYLGRVGGFVAYTLLWLSVAFGLLMTGKVARRWPGAQQALSIHQSISILALVYALFHALILLGDRYMGYTVANLLIPFASTQYRPLWVGLGQVGFYLVVVLTLSFYLRKRIGPKGWRRLHYVSFGLYLLVTAHGLLAGTDARTPFALALYGITGLATYVLTVYRILVTVRSKSTVLKGTHVQTIGHHSAG